MPRVGSCGGCEGGAPETAFDICEAGWVRACGCVGENAGISLEVEVECRASGHCVAFGLADGRAVTLEVIVCQIVAGGCRGLEVHEGLCVAGWCDGA